MDIKISKFCSILEGNNCCGRKQEGGREVAILNGTVRVGFTEKVTFDQALEGNEWVSHNRYPKKRSIPGRGKNQWKGHQV